jgi:hypothetical protein
MRYAGWYPRRRGILQHLDEGTISLLDAAVHDFLCLIADYRTGVAWASAEKIKALSPADISLRAIQRSLARLEQIVWIKRFRTHGKRGNYPVVIGKYFVRSLSMKWMSVSLERTTDWRDIQFDSVTDTSFADDVSRHSGVADLDTELSSGQEGRTENEDARRSQKSAGTSDSERLSARREGLKNKIQREEETAAEFVAAIRQDDPELLRELNSAVAQTGWVLDLNDETVGSGFLLAICDIVAANEAKLANGELPKGLLCTKVIDTCVQQNSVYPPSFDIHRRSLRAQEKRESHEAEV